MPEVREIRATSDLVRVRKLQAQGVDFDAARFLVYGREARAVLRMRPSDPPGSTGGRRLFFCPRCQGSKAPACATVNRLVGREGVAVSSVKSPFRIHAGCLPRRRRPPVRSPRASPRCARRRGARGAAVAGGLRAAVDARREPGQVASRARHVVLRDVRARGAPARLRAVRPRVPRALQLVLQRRRRQASARPSAGCSRGPTSRPCCAYRAHVDAAMRAAHGDGRCAPELRR